MVQNRPGWGKGERYTITKRTPYFALGVSPPHTRFTLPAAREIPLSMPEIDEKERIIYLKS